MYMYIRSYTYVPQLNYMMPTCGTYCMVYTMSALHIKITYMIVHGYVSLYM